MRQPKSCCRPALALLQQRCNSLVSRRQASSCPQRYAWPHLISPVLTPPRQNWCLQLSGIGAAQLARLPYHAGPPHPTWNMELERCLLRKVTPCPMLCAMFMRGKLRLKGPRSISSTL